jgi:hypothetical protein
VNATVLSVLLGCLAILGVVVGWRWADAQAWRRALVAMQLQFPRGLKPDEVSAWLGMLGALRVAIALEVVATRNDVNHYLLVPKARRADLLTGTRAVLPGLRLQDAPDYLRSRPTTWQAATELRITHLSHQLAADRAEATAAAFLGSLAQLEPRETVVIQWLVIGMRTPGLRAASDAARDLARAEKLKYSQPLLQAVGRVAVKTPMRGRAGALLSRITGTLRLLDAPGVAVVRRSIPYRLAAHRLEHRALPVTVWPLAVNVREAVGLVGVPLGDVSHVPGLVLGRSRQLPPGQVPNRGGTAIAVSNYPGQAGQPLVLKPDDRLRHLYVVAPTGAGKSNLLASMAIADAAAGHGLILVDPKADLVETVLERLPETAAERVIVLDPSQIDMPVGFNPLCVSGADEHARELAADRVLHIFKDLYRANWGPRSDDLLRAALHTLVSIPAPNGQAFTICEATELLTRPALRRYAVSREGLPEALKTYWAGFDNLSEAEQLQHIGPVMNKLRAFTMRTATRLLLGASTGIDLGEVMRRRQVLLVSLAKGKLGTETATLSGSLLVASFWQAVLGRANVAPAGRRPFYLYLDEFQDVVRLSESLPDLLSQARGFGIGAVLANQYLAQLPESVRAAVLGTVRSQMCFQVEYDDARLLERRFAPSLTADDLMGLGRFEIALRPSVDGQTAMPVTGLTLPLGEPVREAGELARVSREHWGRARAEVEAELAARTSTGLGGSSGVGRAPRRPTS